MSSRSCFQSFYLPILSLFIVTASRPQKKKFPQLIRTRPGCLDVPTDQISQLFLNRTVGYSVSLTKKVWAEHFLNLNNLFKAFCSSGGGKVTEAWIDSNLKYKLNQEVYFLGTSWSRELRVYSLFVRIRLVC